MKMVMLIIRNLQNKNKLHQELWLKWPKDSNTKKYKL